MHEFKESSNIHAVGWTDGMLKVRFKNGTEYHYYDVPEAEHKKLMDAKSVGKHFGEHIKGKFDHTKKDDWK